jgi:hypothetical protein
MRPYIMVAPVGYAGTVQCTAPDQSRKTYTVDPSIGAVTVDPRDVLVFQALGF